MTPPENNPNHLIDLEYLASLGMAPFYDVGVTTGSALRVLQREEIPEPTEVIKRSTGLLKIAGIHKHPDVLAIAQMLLHEPYAAEECFEIGESKEGRIKIDFTEEMHIMLGALSIGQGCPIGRIASPTNPDSRLLTDYWTRLVDYLIPDNATVLEG